MVSVFRIYKIIIILVRHNLLWLFDTLPILRISLRVLAFWVRVDAKAKHRRKGQNLCQAFQDLGPIFIKFGQVLSVRSDIIGENLAADLRLLQDSLPPFDSDVAVRTIQSRLDKKLDELFLEFDKTPTAAASIAQVHKATTLQGNKVAVKILRPNIEKTFARDVKLFKLIAKLLHIFAPTFRRLRPIAVVETFEEWTKLEIDLTMEAACASEMASNFENRKEKFHVPKVYWEYSDEKILVTEWIDGFRIDDIKALKKAGLDLEEIQLTAARIFFMQIFYDGFFHADMHPGNLFVRADGFIVPVDFGIVGRVDEKSLIFLADLLIGFFQEDYQKIADCHFDYGIVPENHSRHAFALAMRAVGEPLQGLALNEISVGRLLAQLFRTTSKFNMQTQPQLLLLQKTILMAEALGRNLNEKANMWVLTRPLIEDWILLHHSFEARLWKVAKKIVKMLENWTEDNTTKQDETIKQDWDR